MDIRRSLCYLGIEFQRALVNVYILYSPLKSEQNEHEKQAPV